MKLKTKKALISIISFSLVLSININPIAVIAGAVVQSNVFEKLGILKDNIYYLAQNDWSFNTYADSGSSCSCSFSCDAMAAADVLNGSGNISLTDIENVLDNINTDTDHIPNIDTNVETITVNTGTIIDSLSESGVIYKKLSDVHSSTDELESLVKETNSLLGTVISEIQEMQHEYRVAHIYSLNNSWDKALWRPYTEECPYIEDIATVHGKFANVYSGYWNTSVTDVQYEKATKADEIGQQVLDEDLLRAYEVLGYDIIRRAEGAMIGPMAVVSVNDKLQTYSKFLQGHKIESYTKEDGSLGYKYYDTGSKDSVNSTIHADIQLPIVYYSEDIDPNIVTWLDAVTVLYRALDKEKIHYTSHLIKDNSITPETSPLSQNLSGVTKFDGYDYYVFQTRANVIKGKDDATGTYTYEFNYWDNALVDGFVNQSAVPTDPICFSDFCMLAEDMMTAYGEPTIGMDEVKALLQVYGSQFPIQLGTDVADAWAYMMVRGILVDPSINYTDTLTRAELVKMAAAIKDESYRTDFKNIQITLDLSDVMQEDGYYPVDNFEFTQNQFSTSRIYDYALAVNYDYLIPVSDTNMITAPTLYTAMSLDSNECLKNKIPDSKVSEKIELQGKEFYVISVPKTYTGNIWMANAIPELDPGTKADLSTWYCIPSNLLGGGIFSTVTTTQENNATVIKVGEAEWHEFDYVGKEEVIVPFADYMRAGLTERPSPTQVAYGLSGYQSLIACASIMTKHIVIHAANSTNNTNSNASKTVRFSVTGKEIKQAINDGSGTYNDTDSVSLVDKEHISVLKASDITSLTNLPQELSDKKIMTKTKYLTGVTESEYIDIAGSNQTKLLNRLVLSSEFNIPYKEDMKSLLQDSLKGITANNTIDKILNRNSIILYKSNKQLYVERYGISQPTGYYKLFETDMSAFPFLFMIGAGPLQKNAFCNQAYSTVTASTNTAPIYTMSINDEFKISSDGKGALNEYLLNNFDNIISENELNIIDSWRKTHGVTFSAYGKLSNTDYHSSTYYITTKNPEAILSDLGSLEEQYKNGIQGYGNSNSSTTTSLDANLTSSAIMNRSQQVLISWEDLVNCGFIVDNDGTKPPKLNQEGAYTFMTKNGQVIINDVQKTIQIGSTLYDLQYDSGESPTLVYVDNQQDKTMIYLDYRCILGVVSEKFQRTSTTTEFLDDTIGAGAYAIYDLGDGNIDSNTYESLDIVAKNLTSTNYYDIRVVNSIESFDGEETNLKVPYADNLKYKGKRMVAASFVPTANWVTCIDDNGNEKSGSVYVYYPSVAFTEGYISEDGQSAIKPDLTPIKDLWVDVASIVDKANAIVPEGKNSLPLKDALKNTYGRDVSDLDINNSDDLPLIMTYYSIAKLYEKTGVYYFDAAWYVREFDITNNTWYAASTNNNMNDGTDTDGNEIGIMYWVDSVGYVYNIPNQSEFSWKKYFEGDVMLPLVTNSNNQATCILNLNLDYYGTSNPKTGTGQKLIYGTYLRDNGFNYVKCNEDSILDNGRLIPGLEADTLKGKSSETQDGTEILDTPMVVGEDATTYIMNGNGNSIPSVFIPAPAGVYYAFGRNSYETWSVDKLSNYIVDANYVYYGNSQLTLQPKSLKGQSTGFKFAGATTWNAFNIPNSTALYRVHKTNTVSTLIMVPSSLQHASSTGIDSVEINDLSTNPLEDWLNKIGLNSLLQSIDEGASWLIILTFNIIPMIGIILMTILVGLSFLSDNRLVQMLCDKLIDPVKLLTLGRRDIHKWTWKKVLVPCCLMYILFALFLNGNIIMIIQYLAEWYGVVSNWISQTL